jgi:RNA polymerase sigma-70 factor (ECF subfamily)
VVLERSAPLFEGTGLKELAGPKSEEGHLESLIEGIARGEEASLAALYDATSRWTYGLALKVLRDPASAEEVTLDVYLQVWQRAGDYARERGSPESWLLAITRSRAIDRLRAGAAQKRRQEPFDPGLEPAAGGPDPLAASDQNERRGRVHAALASLPAEQRKAIELAFFRGLSHSEVALSLGEPLGTIKTRIRLGMVKLRGLLSPLEERP